MTPDPKDPLSAEIDAALEGVDLQNLDSAGAPAPEKTGAPRSAKTARSSNLRTGTITGITGDDVFVELGPRLQGVISLAEFEERPQVGAKYEFSLHGREDELWLLSRKEALAIAAWDEVEVGSLVKARVSGQNTGGLELKIGPMAAFLPASQVGLRHEDNLASYIGQTLTCLVLEVDRERKRILLSRRAVLEKERESEVKERLGKISTGQTVKGKVTRVEAFGAFVDIGGGLEGLVHVSNLSRRRVENAGSVVAVGQEVQALILEIKDGGKRIGLSMKALEPDPWDGVQSRFSVDSVVEGKVTRIAEFGAFVELEPGLEGLLHVSQIAKDRVRRPRDLLKEGEKLAVRIVAIDPAQRRLSLSRLDPRGAVLGSEEAVDANVIDEALVKNRSEPAKTNLGNLFKKALGGVTANDPPGAIQPQPELGTSAALNRVSAKSRGAGSSSKLRVEDINEGMVAYLSDAVLNSHAEITRPPSPVTRSGPFLCIEADGQRSCWIEITLQARSDRVAIPQSARKGGSDTWRSTNQFINDLRTTYVGPHAAIALAAQAEKDVVGTSRPTVDLEFVSDLRQKVKLAGGTTLA
jgi:predicted RNA-binding protein with RPS1 domain